MRAVAASPGAKLSAGGGGDVTRLQQELHSARTEMSQVKQALEDERQEQAEVAREHTTEITELRQKLERAEQRASLADRMQDEMEELREKEAELVRRCLSFPCAYRPEGLPLTSRARAGSGTAFDRAVQGQDPGAHRAAAGGGRHGKGELCVCNPNRDA